MITCVTFYQPRSKTIANDSILYSIIKIVLLQPLKCRLSYSAAAISQHTISQLTISYSVAEISLRTISYFVVRFLCLTFLILWLE